MPQPQPQGTGVGTRGTPVTKNGVTLGYAWGNADAQRWCAEYQDGPNTNTIIGAATQADAEAWLARRQGVEDQQ
jgi:hypothetical protein